MDSRITRYDAKAGSEREGVIVKLSQDQVRTGDCARGAGVSAHHFFIDDASVCSRPRVFTGLRESPVRKLYPNCFAAVHRSHSHAETFGEL